nr:DNA internalization-related competence protein ComEC/Rec2 [Salinicola sp. S1-1-2]
MPLALAALAGALVGDLPAWPPLPVWLPALPLLLALACRRGIWPMLLMALFLHGVQGSGEVRHSRLPAAMAGQDFVLTGRLSQVDAEAHRTRFRLSVARCHALEPAGRCPPLSSVRLSWYGAPMLAAGERWQLTARLREPLGFANPDTFDYGAWLRREHIDALGYVRGDDAARLSHASFSLRRAALERLDDVSLTPLAHRWLAALTLGADDRLSDADWELFNATGTTHLMVISGLHVGLVATLVLWLLRIAARGWQPHAWRMQVWPWWGAGMAAFAYAGLAGFEPPAMRAAIMASIGLWAASGRHAPGWWQAWWLALAAVSATDPLAPWRPGVWLSFTAVAVLILAWSGRRVPHGVKGWLLALLRSQWLLAPIMAAAVLLAFDRFVPLAPLVNLIAVPLVSSVMVPLAFVGWLAVAWPPLAVWLWWPFERVAHLLSLGLAQAGEAMPVWSLQAWWQEPVAAALLLWGLIWLLPGLTWRWRAAASGLLLVSVGLLQPPALAPDEMTVTVYDVGQGQLVEIDTAQRQVLVDTGPRFSSGFMPASLLWPPGRHFDDVIVTHGDVDHAGGVAALRRQHEVAHWWAPRGNELGLPSRPCEAGLVWQDGATTWRFLSPPANAVALDRNDRSCVLLISSGRHRVLITGDASAARERAFVAALGKARLDLLVAGHHGSATSSSPALVAAARPRDVIFSSGRDNAFGHPAAEVVERFEAAGSRLWNTAYDGAVRASFGADRVEIHAQRQPGWSRRSAVDRSDVGVESSP